MSTQTQMKKYFGSKNLLGMPMTLGEYNEHRGWDIPKDEDPNKEGYLVEYEDGYQSWSPKENFDAAYREITALTFGQAIEAARQGKLIARSGWNGKGMFVFMRPEDSLNIRVIIDVVKSLPNSVKQYFDKLDQATIGQKGLAEIKFTSYFCMKAADNTIVNGWLASQTDMTAEDWQIVE